MRQPLNRSYRTAEFAVLAGVTVRALHYYDRLGLLKPRRSPGGYRLYTERDLETLEEIVTLKFIGVPLKDIAAIRHASGASLAERLRAQRRTLEEKRGTLTRAISAITAAEAALESDRTVPTQLFHEIIEVMHMSTSNEQTIATYMEMLKAKVSRLATLSADDRGTLQRQWSQLVADVRQSLGEDPAGPTAQALLERWTTFLQALTGADVSKITAPTLLEATPDIHAELVARQAEWLSPAHGAQPISRDEAPARARKLAESIADPDVLEFIRRARAARQA
jgi:DNA-binding transcriptional MerR regulator